MEEVAVQALNLGADHYVNKGFNPEIMFSELAHDISQAVERRRAYLEAWVEQEKLRAIFDSSPNPIIIVDLRGNIVECNQETLRLTKMSSKKEIIGRSALDFVEEKDRRLVSENLEKALLQDTVKDIEFGLSNRLGTGYVGEISASAIKDSDGNPTSLVVIISDTTERKQAENRLRQYSKRLEENQRFLEDIFSAFPDPVTVCDLNGNIIKSNQATLDLYVNSSKDELTGVNLNALLVPTDCEKVLGELDKAKVLGSVKNVECNMIGRKGNEFPAELSVGAIKESSGKPLGFVVITKDITNRKRLQEQLIVSEKLAAVGRLAASFSHDIRNPLAVIKNSVCFLEMRLKENADDKVMKHLRMLEEEINYSDILINNLLDFTKKNPPYLHEANLNEVTKAAISSVAIPENIEIIFKLNEIPTMLIDEAQLKRVFTNIVLNALQAMPDGGKLTVQTSRDQDFVETAFSDTGTGICEENMQKMFTPFFSTKANGVGLGLNICKQIVEGHGGKICVRSKIGEGSTFTIRLLIHAEEKNVVMTSAREVTHTRR
jgi:two-component system NtrC family sensor kinase